MLGTLPHREIDAFVLQFLSFEFRMVGVVLLRMRRATMKRYHNTVRPYDEIIHLTLTLLCAHQVLSQNLSTFDPIGLQPFQCAAPHNDYLIFFFHYYLKRTKSIKFENVTV